MKHNFKILFMVFAMVSTMSCGTLPKPGFPDQSLDDLKLIEKLEEIFAKGTEISDYYDTTKTPLNERQTKRDMFVTGHMALIDLHYNRFVQRLTINKQSIDTAADIMELGVGLAIPLSGGEETKNILGAISAGITGTRLSIDKNFFFEKTVPVLVSEMNAQRKNTRIPILLGLNRQVTEYPLTQALVDLNNYYFAGTFAGALQSIQAQAGVTEKAAEKEIRDIIKARYAATDRDLRDRINNWIDDPAKQASLDSWLKNQNIDIISPLWVDDAATTKEALEAAIKHFNIP